MTPLPNNIILFTVRLQNINRTPNKNSHSTADKSPTVHSNFDISFRNDVQGKLNPEDFCSKIFAARFLKNSDTTPPSFLFKLSTSISSLIAFKY